MQLRRPLILIALVIGASLVVRSCGTGKVDAETAQIFTVSRTAETGAIKEKLLSQEFAQGRPLLGFFMLLHGGYRTIDPGGFRIPEDVGTWQLTNILTSDPPLKWVVIPEGYRKEQVAEKLQTTLGWDTEKKDRFLSQDVQTPYDLKDGFYFPDTYLIPTDEPEDKVLRRFINRFNEQFDPLYDAFAAENIRFDSAVRLASIIQREAAGSHDMPLIAGILWNRLLVQMPLEVDATLQYVVATENCSGPREETGKRCEGWWAAIDPSAKKIDSPYNTYKYAGLPPGPISNPGLAAIKAVLKPEETECIFYIHAPDRQIHCAVTYEEHLDNIDEYLR